MAPKGEGKSMLSVRKAHFFKVLLGDFAERLMIPPNFMKHIASENLQKAILQGPSCMKWQVELVRSKGGTFLLNGWQKFVKDHSLREYEFLLFRYDGDMHFTVSVFDTSACEREDLFEVGMQKRSKLFEEREAITTKQYLDICSLVNNDADEIDFTASHVKTEIFEEYESKPSQNGCSNSLLGRCVPYHVPPPKVETEAKIFRKQMGAPVRQYRCAPKRQLRSTNKRSKAQEAANSFTSVHPFTIVCMRPREVYTNHPLRLPVRFSREHLPQIRTEMVLHVTTGKSWMVGFRPGVRSSFGKGWSAFVRGNSIKVGDYCVFELLGPTKFHVHIFRSW